MKVIAFSLMVCGVLVCSTKPMVAQNEAPNPLAVAASSTVIVPLVLGPYGNQLLDFNADGWGGFVPLYRSGFNPGQPVIIPAQDVSRSVGEVVSGMAGDGIVFQLSSELAADGSKFRLKHPTKYNSGDNTTYIDCEVKNPSTGQWKVVIRTNPNLIPVPANWSLYTPGTGTTLSPDNSGNALEVSAPASRATDGLGQVYINIGGQIKVRADQRRGKYTGTVILTAMYN